MFQSIVGDGAVGSSLVQRALLKNITILCTFLGRKRTTDVILPLLFTFLNGRDRELRAAFFEHIIAIGVIVGAVSMKMFILPCIEQAVGDVEEAVVIRAVRCLESACSLHLLDRRTLLDLAKKICPLLLHPNTGVRYSVVGFIVAASRYLGFPDHFVMLLPILKPYIRSSYIGKVLTEKDIIGVLYDPLPRDVYNNALVDYGEDEYTQRGTTDEDLDKLDRLKENIVSNNMQSSNKAKSSSKALSLLGVKVPTKDKLETVRVNSPRVKDNTAMNVTSPCGTKDEKDVGEEISNDIKLRYLGTYLRRLAVARRSEVNRNRQLHVDSISKDDAAAYAAKLQKSVKSNCILVPAQPNVDVYRSDTISGISMDTSMAGLKR